MATKLPYLNVLEVESVNKEDVSRAIVIDKDEYVKALDIEQITTYQGLSNKPKINGVELDGDISLDELNVASKEDLNKVISDLEDITSDIPTSENVQDKIDDSLKNYPTKSDVTTEINNSIADKADKSEIPTKVSQLENDEGYLTTIPSEYVTESELNDKGYLTSESLTTINSDIDELETSKQEAFQVNQPLVFSRSGEDLVLDVNLDNYVTDTELNTKQDKLTPGDNINITDNVISWEAPDIQFVNTIFTDDESLKYTVSDFNGTSTEKTFPVATQTSAGLMSVADKTKLDNLDEGGGSIPYLKVGLTSIVSGDFDAVYNAIENDEAYFLQVPWSGGEIYGYFINPETVWASNNTIYCISQEHKSDGSFDQFN